MNTGMNTGWFKLHRKLMSSPVWLNSSAAHKALVITILSKVNYADQKWWDEDARSELLIPEGSFVTTYRLLAEASETSVGAVRNALKRLVGQDFCTVTTRPKYTVIAVLKWTYYQGHCDNNTQEAREKHAGSTQEAHIKEDKKETTKETTQQPNAEPPSEEQQNINPTTPSKPTTPPPPYAEFMDKWNAEAKIRGFRPCKDLNPARRASLKTRWAEPFFRENWIKALKLIWLNPWNLGENDRSWKATVSWFLKPDTVLATIERSEPTKLRGRRDE